MDLNELQARYLRVNDQSVQMGEERKSLQKQLSLMTSKLGELYELQSALAKEIAVAARAAGESDQQIKNRTGFAPRKDWWPHDSTNRSNSRAEKRHGFQRVLADVRRVLR